MQTAARSRSNTLRAPARAASAAVLLAAMSALSLLSACGGGGSDAPAAAAATAQAGVALLAADGRATALAAAPAPGLAQPAARTVDDPEAVEVGNELFHDPRLSASGQMSCGSCHIQMFGHADAPGVGLPLGGPGHDLAGMRSSQTTRYLNLTPPFRLAADGTPSGGHLWDGRADDRFEQVFHGGPFFNPVEMALPGSNAQPQAVTDRVRAAAYWPRLQALYAGNPAAIATDQALFREISKLIEIYQRDDVDYNLFDAKFDRVQAGEDVFTPAEARGWAVFSNPAKGNCTSCHTASLNERSLFTNFGYAALGVPRNHAGPKNADPAYFDLGLCARDKPHAKSRTEQQVRQARYCGLFKTPTLRNIERTGPYFHNAAIASLKDAVRFHFERDRRAGTRSATWYRKADGSPDRAYNDLPLAYVNNLSRGAPFDGAYVPSEAELQDLLAFLSTLNDGDQLVPLPQR